MSVTIVPIPGKELERALESVLGTAWVPPTPLYQWFDGSSKPPGALAGRYNLHSPARRVRFPGRGSGRLLASRDRMGAGQHAGRRAAAGGAPHGVVSPLCSPGLSASLRSRQPIREPRLYGSAEGESHRDQHVAQGESLGTTRPVSR